MNRDRSLWMNITLIVLLAVIIGGISYACLEFFNVNKYIEQITFQKVSKGITGFSTASTSATVTNSAPTTASVSANDAAAAITLSGTRAPDRVICNGTITDTNGCTQISGVIGTFFRTGMANPESGLTGSLNTSERYYNATCAVDPDNTCTGSTDTTVDYFCSFTVYPWAVTTTVGPNTADTWTCNMTPSDASAGTSGTDTIEMNSLVEFDFNSTIAFGSLSLGQLKENVTTEVNNTGNTQFDVSISGYGVSANDGFSFNCTPTGNISNVTLRYMYANPFAYSDAAYNLSNGALANANFNLMPTLFNTVTGELTTGEVDPKGLNYPNQSIYWGLQIPSTGVGGTCTGTIVITAAAG